MADERTSPGETMMRMSWAVGLAVGVGTGVALGSALRDMGVGIAIGLGLGVAVMAAFSVTGARMRRQAASGESPAEEPPGDQGSTGEPGRLQGEGARDKEARDGGAAHDGGAQPPSDPRA
ncbi:MULTISPECIES: hypothetical protein [Bacteria]|uniref:hypothetical protein n=1 Tax=Bacteria TaxID=2 RepID=UPI003C7C2584